MVTCDSYYLNLSLNYLNLISVSSFINFFWSLSCILKILDASCHQIHQELYRPKQVLSSNEFPLHLMFSIFFGELNQQIVSIHVQPDSSAQDRRFELFFQLSNLQLSSKNKVSLIQYLNIVTRPLLALA